MFQIKSLSLFSTNCKRSLKMAKIYFRLESYTKICIMVNYNIDKVLIKEWSAHMEYFRYR